MQRCDLWSCKSEMQRSAWRGDMGGFKVLIYLGMGMYGRLMECFSYSYFSFGEMVVAEAARTLLSSDLVFVTMRV